MRGSYGLRFYFASSGLGWGALSGLPFDEALCILRRLNTRLRIRRRENIVGEIQLLADELLALLSEKIVVVSPGECILHNATGLKRLHYTIDVKIGGIAELAILIDIRDPWHVPYAPVFLQSQRRILVQMRVNGLVDCLRNVDHSSGSLFSKAANSF